MSNIKPTQAETSAVILSQLQIDAARDAGGRGVSGRTALIDVLKTYQLYNDAGELVATDIPTRDCDLATMIKVASYEGAMRDGCHVSIDEAKRLLTLSASTHKTAKAEDKRTEEQDRVYSLAKANWSLACDACGLPKAGVGGNRGARAETVRDAPITIEAFHVPHGLDTEHAVSEFAKIADLMQHILKANAATITGDAGSILRQCVKDVGDYISDAKLKLEADQPVLTAEEAMEAKIIAKLAAQGAFKAKFKLAA
jgi:hypothetical protein